MLKVIILNFLLFMGVADSSEKSICGSWDDRRPSYDEKVARIQKKEAKSGCSLTMISKTCAITAGHCEKHFVDAHFNVPRSDDEGNINTSSLRDIYPVTSTIDSVAEGKGSDFAVLVLGRNAISHKYPGEIQGFYYISLSRPKVGDIVRVTGFGADRDQGDETLNYTQQSGFGEVALIDQTVISYRADTWGGSSGSPIIYENKVIGVHTHGNCESDDGVNSGTLISEVPRLKSAVLRCFALERRERYN